jgi:hypothetical protein
VVSERVEGERLSEILAHAQARAAVPDVTIALHIVIQVLQALAALDKACRTAHGAIGLERLIVTPQGRVVVAEHMLAPLIQKLNFSAPFLWRELRVAMPVKPATPRFDARADVAQAAVLLIACAIGRPLTDDEYPDRLAALAGEVREIARIRGGDGMAEGVGAWLDAALPIARKGIKYADAAEARFALERALPKEPGLIGTQDDLREFLQQIELPEPETAAPPSPARPARAAAQSRAKAQKAAPPPAPPAVQGESAQVAPEEPGEEIAIDLDASIPPEATKSAAEDLFAPVSHTIETPIWLEETAAPPSPPALGEREPPIEAPEPVVEESAPLIAEPEPEAGPPAIVGDAEPPSGPTLGFDATAVAEAKSSFNLILEEAEAIARSTAPPTEPTPEPLTELEATPEPPPEPEPTPARVEPVPIEPVVEAAEEQPVPLVEAVDAPALVVQEPAATIVSAEPVPAIEAPAPIVEATGSAFEETAAAVEESTPVSEPPARRTEEAAPIVEEPAPVVVEEPAPVVIEEPAPVVVEMRAPVVIEEPAPVVVEEPTPVVAAAAEPIAVAQAAVVGESVPVVEAPAPVIDEPAVIAAVAAPVVAAPPAEVEAPPPEITPLPAPAPAPTEIREFTVAPPAPPAEALSPPVKEPERPAEARPRLIGDVDLSKLPDWMVHPEEPAPAPEPPRHATPDSPHTAPATAASPPPLPTPPTPPVPPAGWQWTTKGEAPVHRPSQLGAAGEPQEIELPEGAEPVTPPKKSREAIADEIVAPDIEEEPTRQPVRLGRLAAIAAVLVAVAAGGYFGVLRYWSRALPGTVVIESTPEGSEVLIDGAPSGKTPLTLQLMPGDHRLELRRGRRSHVFSLTVVGGSEVTQSVDWGRLAETGNLRVTSDPEGAEVLIDGEERGKTPLELSGLRVGEHEVVVRTDKGSVANTVRIRPNETTPLNVGVYSGWLAVFAPVELKIYEGGKLVGSSSDGRIMVRPGRHEVELVNDELGYRSTEVIQVAPGQVGSMSIEPKGQVNINAIPWAEVFVDDERLGETPLANVSVTIGTREFVFRHPELGERRITVTVTLKEAATVSIDLNKQ